VASGVRLGSSKGIGRCRSNAWRNHEGFDIELADELGIADPVLIGHDVSLVPRQAKRKVWYLGHEQSEVGVRWQTSDSDFHDVILTNGVDSHLAVRVGRNGRGIDQTWRALEIEFKVISIIIIVGCDGCGRCESRERETG